jgi:hypothetical protein
MKCPPSRSIVNITIITSSIRIAAIMSTFVLSDKPVCFILIFDCGTNVTIEVSRVVISALRSPYGHNRRLVVIQELNAYYL